MAVITTASLLPKDLWTHSCPKVSRLFLLSNKKSKAKNHPPRSVLVHKIIQPMVQIIYLFLQRQDHTPSSACSSLSVLPVLRSCLPELWLHHSAAQVKLPFLQSKNDFILFYGFGVPLPPCPSPRGVGPRECTFSATCLFPWIWSCCC